MSGMREPSEEEIQKVARYYKKLYEKDIRRCTAAGAVFIVAATACFLGAGAVSILAGIVFALLAVSMLRGRCKAKSSAGIFARGEFKVMDGDVSDIHANADFPDMHNVKFRSEDGSEVGSWWAVRDEGLEIGTPLLLVYASRQASKQEIKKVFTPFMLTEEGLKGTMVH